MEKTIHILLLEDNAADADLIEFELREAGINFTLKRVMTENDFTRALKESLPDLILSDYDLPQYNGALALAEIRKNYPDIPFILVTGAISEDRAIDTLTSGAKDYVMKSRLSRLAPAIRRVLKESEEINARKTAQEELRKAHKMLEGKVKKRTAKLLEEIKERKKIEKALRESQFNTNTLLNSATESIWMFGVNGDILAANDTVARRFNLTVSDVMGKKWTDFLSPDLAQSRQRVFEEVVNTGKPVDYEDEREGIIFHHHFYPARNTAGKIIGVVSFSRDISENKKIEAAIKRMASFPMLNPNPVIEVDMASQIIFANPASEELFSGLLKEGVEHPLLEGWAEIIRTLQQGREKEFSSEVHFKGKWYLLEFSFVADFQSIRIYGLDITKRKIAEDELLESKKKISSILDSIADTYIAYDRQLRISDMNIKMEKLLGLSRDGLIGKVLWEVFPEMKNGEFTRQFQKAIADNTPIHFEAMSVFGKWFETHAYPSAHGVDVYLRDVTLHKQAEEALHKSDEHFAITLASIGDAVIAADIEGKITFMNAVAEEITGWKLKEARLKPIEVVFHIINEQTRREEESPVKRVLETGMTVGLSSHTIMVRNDKTEVAIANSAAPIKDQQGNITGVVLVFRDITEYRKKEANLHRLNRTFMALSSSNQALLHADDESTYMKEICRVIREDCGHAMVWIGFAEDNEDKSVRPAAYAGFEEGYIETLKITWADTERGRGPTGTAIRTGKPTGCRNMLIDPQFSPWLEEAKKRGYASSISLPLMSEGRAFGALTIYSAEPDAFQEDEIKLFSELATDLAYGITNLRRRVAHAKIEEALADQAAKLQERTTQLEDINTELESFSYSVSHDLRAPLRAIDGYARMILKRQGDNFNEDTKEKFNVIRRSSQMMGKMIDDLLSFSRLGRMEISMTILDMEGLINDVWKEIQIINPDRKLVLKVNNIQRGRGDRSLIRQVYSNLLSNAVKYTKLSKEAGIETGSYKQGCEDIYYVKDNGIGFNMDYYDKLFGVFQRLHAADEYEGTGVGLAIVQRIIHRHGGRVWAQSEEGNGATFYFTLLRKD